MMRAYKYTGPATSATLRQEDGSDLEVVLSPDKTLDLPEESSYVQGLVALDRLQALPLKGKRPAGSASSPDPLTT